MTACTLPVSPSQMHTHLSFMQKIDRPSYFLFCCGSAVSATHTCLQSLTPKQIQVARLCLSWVPSGHMYRLPSKNPQCSCISRYWADSGSPHNCRLSGKYSLCLLHDVEDRLLVQSTHIAFSVGSQNPLCSLLQAGDLLIITREKYGV